MGMYNKVEQWTSFATHSTTGIKGGFLEESPLLFHQILQKWLLGNNRRRDNPL
jgi:hypothetical protein